jgi:hypothetical protein
MANRTKLTLAALLLASFAPIAVSAATLDTMVLHGSVAEILSVDFQPKPIATALDLSTEATGLDVADVAYRSNAPYGYRLSFSSQNAGKLVATAPGNPDTLSYSLAFGGTSFSLANGEVSFDSATVTPAEGEVKNLAISYPQTWLRSGGYEDTLTVTIAAL